MVTLQLNYQTALAFSAVNTCMKISINASHVENIINQHYNCKLVNFTTTVRYTRLLYFTSVIVSACKLHNTRLLLSLSRTLRIVFC
jgi:hypothetical protein